MRGDRREANFWLTLKWFLGLNLDSGHGKKGTQQTG